MREDSGPGLLGRLSSAYAALALHRYYYKHTPSSLNIFRFQTPACSDDIGFNECCSQACTKREQGQQALGSRRD